MPPEVDVPKWYVIAPYWFAGTPKESVANELRDRVDSKAPPLAELLVSRCQPLE